MTYFLDSRQSLLRLGLALLFVFLAADPAASTTPVGVIAEVRGPATVNGQDARVGMPLNPADSIQTGARGMIRVVFSDRSVIEVRENSGLFIKDCVTDSEKDSRFGVIGAMYAKVATWVRDMTGWFKKESQATETAVIGVRGIVPQKEGAEPVRGDSSVGPVPQGRTSEPRAPGFGNRIAPHPGPRSSTPPRNHEWNGTRRWITG